MIRKNQIGDTIVEVMLAIAILGTVLAAAYGTAARSLRISRQSQERAEATKILENQFEILKAYVSQEGVANRNIFIATPFCIDSVTQNVLQMVSLAGARPSITPVQTANLSTTAPNQYASECVRSGRYYLSIEYAGAAQGQFTTIIRWDRAGGGRDELRAVYRLHRSPSP